MTSSRLMVAALVFGALLGAPKTGRSSEDCLTDEDVLGYYGEHVRGCASGIYARRGWVFFHQRVPITGEGLVASSRAFGCALGNVRRDIFVSLNNLAGKIPLPVGPAYGRIGKWALVLVELQGGQEVAKVPSKGVARTEEDGDCIYALAISEKILRTEADRGAFAEKATEIAEAWRLFCEEETPAGDARAAVVATLARSGVRIGVDRARRRYVFIGTSECDMEEPARDREFLKKRRACTVRAEINARRELVKARGETVTAEDSAHLAGDGEGAGLSLASYSEILAREALNGVIVLTTAESWNPAKKRYQVAVAVAWSEALVVGNTGGALEKRAFREDGSEDPEWAKWVKTQDLASLFGTRTFKDGNGARRFVALGFADVEGKQGPALRMAYRMSQMYAMQALGFFVNFDLASREALTSLAQSVSAGSVTESEAWEKYESLVSMKCKEIPLRIREVYATDVRHPLTGHLMHVSVVGLVTEKTNE